MWRSAKFALWDVADVLLYERNSGLERMPGRYCAIYIHENQFPAMKASTSLGW